MQWESPDDGTLTEIYVEEGGKVNVGDKIAFIGGEGEEAPKKEEKDKKPEPKEQEKPKEPKKEEKPEEPKEEKKEEKKAAPPKAEKKKPEAEGRPPAPEKVEGARVKASPVARRVAAEFGVDLSSVTGTGPEGRVTESDVRAAAKSKPAAPKPIVPPVIKAGESARIQLSGMRKIIAQRLVESLGPVPHLYLTIE